MLSPIEMQLSELRRLNIVENSPIWKMAQTKIHTLPHGKKTNLVHTIISQQQNLKLANYLLTVEEGVIVH